MRLLHIALGLAFVAIQAVSVHGQTMSDEPNCENPRPDYTPAELAKPMAFIYPERFRCWGNAVSKPILAVGTIDSDTPKKFLEYISAYGGNGVVEFHSPGGEIDPAMELGEIIRKNEMGTSLGTVCASACAYAFIGGVRRYAVNNKDVDYTYKYREIGAVGDRFGVHQFYEKSALAAPANPSFTAHDRANDQDHIAKIIEYVIKMGVDPQLVIIASQIKPWDTMKWLSKEERIRLRIDNMTKLYSQITVKPFGRYGLYAEVMSTLSSDRSAIRLFCKKKMDGLFATFVIYDKDANEYADMISKMVGHAEFDDATIDPVPIVVTDRAEKYENGIHNVYIEVYIQNIPISAADKLKYISVYDPDLRLSRARQWVNDLTKFRISGDRRLIGIAMRNCIN